MVYQFPNVKQLILSGLNIERNCDLTAAENSTFAEMKSLQILNKSGCGITRITAGAFEHLHNLRVLDISYNRQLGFKSLENVTYGLQLPRISHLKISYLHNTFGLGIK
ncbi:hypothetical protein DPMN_187306 [Dreissena polymorpha]|uniref:Toll-like receptor 4 n=1 Tax=Dreissena polymorpha TaxID=45954 RepID=A0A9D4IAB3_DREPO|nr:hypothetical protein DPMN_187306 [Dreissena polymorpha]